MKKKKLVIIILLIVLIIILLFFSINKKDNKNQNSIKTNNISNETNTSVNNSSNKISSGNKKVNEKLRKNFSDYDWLQNNIYIRKNCFGKDVNLENQQVFKYMKVYKQNSDEPIILIYAECEKESSNQLFMVTSQDEGLNVTSLTETATHLSHNVYKFNSEEKVVYQKINYENSEEYVIYKITDDNKFERLYYLKETNSIVNSKIEHKYYCNNRDSSKEEFDKIKSIYVTQKSELTNFKELNLNEVNKIFL
ncbi:TPA: hypothetical protein CPT93_07820 [Candidatus Gastranaerophilales bacterium HUM_7]|jgi:hypothetical protein|nr:MAG TPA: hypothetical protein CPT93_07820 [Candidatus Gastranaerophilales bacterium HUM_7]HJJ11076.1 hypothetical protein [Clostridiaceae bacterium]